MIDAKIRVEWVRITVILAFLIGIISSFKLWTSDRVFPLSPIVDNFTVSNSLNYYVFGVFIGTLILFLLKFNRITLIFFLTVLVFLIFQDQNRIQPWVYFYGLILVSFFNKDTVKREQDILTTVQIIVVFLYFWSGVHKINASFLNVEFPQMLSDLFKNTEGKFIDSIKKVSFSIPTIEIICAALLILKKTRQIGFWISVLSHVFIIVLLSPLGLTHNSIVIPWNLAIILLNFIVFYKNNEPIRIGNWRIALMIWFVGIMPIFNLLNFWDDYLSWSLYSSKNKLFYIAVSEKYWTNVNRGHEKVLLELPNNTQGGYIIDVNKWSLYEMNVPVNPEQRIFQKIGVHFCKYNIPDSDLLFLMYFRPMKDGNLVKWTCAEYPLSKNEVLR
jgi:hypothetical protein